MKCAIILLAAAALAADRTEVSRRLKERTGHELNPAAFTDPRKPPSLPPGVTLAERITESDAVAIALWNNAALHADLAALGVARAELVDAGLLRNLNLQMLLPVGVKPFEMLLQAPVEALWQRPRRVAAARLQLDHIGEGLVQNGLDLARDVRRAHAALALAGERARISAQSARQRFEIAELYEKRLAAGDISDLEAAQTRLDARAEQAQMTTYARDVEIAREALRALMGLRGDKTPFTAAAADAAPAPPPDWEQLLETAVSSRPDLRAAEVAIQAAVQRAGWERARIVNLLIPGLSVKGIGDKGIKAGPGFQADLPLWNRNEGGRSRADAEVERATHAYLALRARIEQEVRTARLELAQAREALDHVRSRLLPEMRRTIELAEKAYAAGDTSYLDSLIAGRRLYDIQQQEASALAAARRSEAELERSVGRRL